MDNPTIAEKVQFWQEQDRINQALIPRLLKTHELAVEMSKQMSAFAKDIAAAESRVVKKCEGEMANAESKVIDTCKGDLAKAESRIIETHKIDLAGLESRVSEKHKTDMKSMEATLTKKTDNSICRLTEDLTSLGNRMEAMEKNAETLASDWKQENQQLADSIRNELSEVKNGQLALREKLSEMESSKQIESDLKNLKTWCLIASSAAIILSVISLLFSFSK